MTENTIGRKSLFSALLPEHAINHVEIQEISFPPGQTAPYHLHPCPVIGYIVSGEVTLQVEGDEIQHLHAGDAFYEPADTPIVHFDNASASEPMTFVACYLLHGESETTRIL